MPPPAASPGTTSPASPRTNPPPFFLGIDVGGTNVKAGVVDNAGVPMSHVSFPTEAERGPEHGLQTLARAARAAMEQAGLSYHDLRAVGLATPGTMDLPAGMLLDPPNLPGWTNFPIRDRLARELQLPVTLQNDANAAAYGEFWAGRGRDADSLVLWTMGTGIGCGIIIGDLILEGAHSHGAECGHIIIEMHRGRRCDTGQYGTLEAYAGAKGLLRRCEEALDAGRASSLHEFRARHEPITPLAIAQAAEANDPLADELILETARYMAVGTVTLMHTIDPDMVLLGGAMTFGRDQTAVGRRFLAELRHEVRLRAFPVPYARTVIDFASLGGHAGFIGAAGCARLKYGRKS